MKKSELFLKVKCEIESLLLLSESYVEKDLGIHEIEKGLLSQLLSLGLLLLSYIIEEKSKKLDFYKIRDKSIKNTGMKSRKYLSLFGLLEIKRSSYWSKKLGQVFKLDELLKLPRGIYWSYNIQEIVGTNSTETDYRESVQILNDLLNLGLSGKGSERNTDRLGSEVEGFYGLNTYQSEEEGEYFMCGFDGKGIPKIKPGLSIRNNPKDRLRRGEKRGVKQMATVSITASFTTKEKSSEEVIVGLMGIEKSKNKGENRIENKGKNTGSKFYKNIHRRGFLANQEKAIKYGIEELKARMINPQSRFVVPIDAGIGLEDKILGYIKKNKLEDKFDGIVLDIVHVSEYIWESGTAIFGEKSKFRRPWVRMILKDLLEGKTEQVIDELKLNRDKTTLTKSKKEQLNKTITYFTNHKHKMNYQWFLKKGYPISSAIVESTCKHLIKDRMEQSGMRWSSVGAQNMMDLRAVKINGDMNEFMDYVIKKDRKTKLIKTAA